VLEDEAIFLDASAEKLYINKGNTDFATIIGSQNEEAFRVDSLGVIINENNYPGNDFRVETQLLPGAIIVDSNKNQVALGTNSTDTTFKSCGDDVSVYLSGTIGGKDGSSPKVIVAGSDLVVSGDIYGPADSNLVLRSDSGVRMYLDSDDDIAAAAFNIYDGAGANAHTIVETGEVVFNLKRDALGDFMVWGDTDKALIFSDAGEQAVALGWDGNQIGGGGSRPEWSYFNSEDIGPDVKIVLSGALGGKGGTTRNTTLNAGDFVSSGSIYTPTLRALQTRLDVFGNNSTSQMFILSGSGAKADEDESTYPDLAFFVSGSKNSKNSNTKGTALFGGDTAVSGTLYTDTIQALNGNLLLKAISNNADIEFHIDDTETKVLMIDGSVQGNLLFTPKSSGKMVLSASGGEGKLELFADGGAIDLERYITSATGEADLNFVRSQGDADSKAAVNNSTKLGAINFRGYKTAVALGTAAQIIGECDTGTIDVSSLPAKLVFKTAGDGTSLATKMVVRGNGNVGIGSDEDQNLHAKLDVRGNALVTGHLSASMGLSGSLTRLTDGTSYLIAGSGINIASASNGAVTITGTATSAEWTEESDFLRPNDGAADNVGVGGTGNTATTYGAVIFGSTGNIVSKGFISGSLGISGSLTRLTDGTSYIKAGTGITVTSASNGAITITSTGGGGSASDVGWLGPKAGVINTTGSLGVTGSLDVAQDIRHIGDEDNKISFTADAISVSKPLTVSTISGSYAEINKIYASGSDSRFIADGDMYFRVDRNNDAAAASWRFENGTGTEIANLDETGKLTLAGGAELIGGGTFACSINANFNNDVTLGNSTSDDITFTGRAASHLLPKADSTYDLGSADNRWANIYTGDLHLRNDKGNWTIQEDSDKLIVINNLTGKKYKMMLAPLEDNE